MTLLQLSEPAPFTIERADAGSGFVLACDHASNRIPQKLGTLGLSLAQLESHIAWDLGAAAVASHLAELLDATLVRQNYSRLVIDCNRPLEAADSIAVRSESVAILANAGLTGEQRTERQEEIFAPYHAALRDVLDRRLRSPRDATHPRLISIHSFTPAYHGVARPWHAGVLFNRDRWLGQQLLRRLSRDGHLHVGENEPYAMEDASDYTLVVHGERRGIPHAGIEIRQDLIAEESGQRLWARRLAAHLNDILTD
jgi:predicted N-formylglutamate amidohydrolase